jgi:alkanesulfonate monooxygenase SsuD/methylene tetrahydromethanopterin reductase-like flavin-dependent oxidoreductase (luciferase family)
MDPLPSISLTGISRPGWRAAAIEIAQEAERLGFPSVVCAGDLGGAGMALCHSLAHVTSRLRFGTNIVSIYGRNPVELAQSAAYLREVSGDRFSLGLGVSHVTVHRALGVQPGKPLGDMREYVRRVREASAEHGTLPPLVLAALRSRMTALAAEIGDGVVFANLPRSAAEAVVAAIPAERRAAGFTVANFIPVSIDDDPKAAEAAARRVLRRFFVLPNYLALWREKGFGDALDGIEQRVPPGDRETNPEIVPTALLKDVVLHGSAERVREGVASWFAAGITPILSPVSADGEPLRAYRTLLNTLAAK